VESVTDKVKVKRIVLIILSTGFSILYFICGIFSINQGVSTLILFKMEYGLLFVYATYRLYISNKSIVDYIAYNTDISEHFVNSDGFSNADKTVEQLIKDTMICLEDEDFERALSLIDKVDTLNIVDQNIDLLKNIVNQSLIKNEIDYSQSFCY